MSRYFEKNAGGLASILTMGGTKLMGSKFFKPLVSTFGSKGTINALQKSDKISGAFKDDLIKSVNSALPKSRLETIDNPAMVSKFKDFTGPYRMRDYIAKQDPNSSFKTLKGIGDYFKNEVLGGPGTGFKHMKTQWQMDKYNVDDAGKLFRKSKGALFTGRALNVLPEMYFAGDAAFGELQPGESRMGKIMGAAGFSLGARTARKGIAGMIRGFGLNYAGSKIGNQFGAMPQQQLPKIDELQKQTMNYQ